MHNSERFSKSLVHFQGIFFVSEPHFKIIVCIFIHFEDPVVSLSLLADVVMEFKVFYNVYLI